jgi:hypothetical protein
VLTLKEAAAAPAAKPVTVKAPAPAASGSKIVVANLLPSVSQEDMKVLHAEMQLTPGAL